jgi:hypothetical protein
MRSERLVLRIHSDLMHALTFRSKQHGMTRSMFIEKILIGYMNANEAAGLDGLGRRMTYDPEGPAFQHVGPFLRTRPAGMPPIQYPPPKPTKKD